MHLLPLLLALVAAASAHPSSPPSLTLPQFDSGSLRVDPLPLPEDFHSSSLNPRRSSVILGHQLHKPLEPLESHKPHEPLKPSPRLNKRKSSLLLVPDLDGTQRSPTRRRSDHFFTPNHHSKLPPPSPRPHHAGKTPTLGPTPDICRDGPPVQAQSNYRLCDAYDPDIHSQAAQDRSDNLRMLHEILYSDIAPLGEANL